MPISTSEDTLETKCLFWILHCGYHRRVNLLAARLLGWLLGDSWHRGWGVGFIRLLHRDNRMIHCVAAKSLGFQ